MTGGTTPFARQFGTKLARRAEFNVVGKQLLVVRVRPPVDDDLVRFQLEAGHIHEAVLDAAPEQDRDPDDGKTDPANRRPAG